MNRIALVQSCSWADNELVCKVVLAVKIPMIKHWLLEVCRLVVAHTHGLYPLELR